LNNEVTKNDKAWKLLFDKYKILDAIDTHGYFQIDAAQINEFREARLMTKFDHKANLPELFSKHNLPYYLSLGVVTSSLDLMHIKRLNR